LDAIGTSKLGRAVREPRRIPSAVARRLMPNHPRYGYEWVRRPDGSVTFREHGFVAADSPALLLARHNYETEYIRRLLAGLKARRSLEVGSGYGRLTPTFASFSSEHIAVDINPDALAQARVTYPEHDFREASVTALPFPDDHVDLVVTWTVIQHVPPEQIATACAEILRVLAPGGTLLICEETRHAGHTSPKAHTWHRRVEEYEELFAPLGLERSCYIDELDRIPRLESPGRLMLFRSPAAQ
jgi:SAM-dependent methyltransferase